MGVASQASSSGAATAVMERVVTLAEKHETVLQRVTWAVEATAKTSGIHEARWCGALGEGTDGARFQEAWSIGESACLFRGVRANQVRAICEGRSTRGLSYEALFAAKDRRRAEWFVQSFWRTCIEDSDKSEDFIDADGMCVTGSRLRRGVG